MRGFSRCAWVTAFALFLGCASSEEGAAQDTPPPAGPTPAPTPGGTTPAAPPRPAPKFVATVKDRYLAEPWQLRDARLFVPEVSLFGGGGGEETRELLVKVGAAEVAVPLERVSRIEVGDQDEDLLAVTVLVRPTEGETPQPLKGTVRSSLELRGVFGTSDLKTAVKLRELAWVELAPVQ